MLLRECAEAGVGIRLGCSVARIRKDETFVLMSNLGQMECRSLVIASGGLSIPKMGATDFGYKTARRFGIRMTEVRPGLVPLTLGGYDVLRLPDLIGVSLDAN